MTIVDTNETTISSANAITEKSEKSIRSLTYTIVGIFIVGMIVSTAVAIWFLLQISATTVFN